MSSTGIRALAVGAVLLTACAWGGGPARAAGAATSKEASAVWRKVQASSVKLDRLIQSRKLQGVHQVAFQIRDLVNTLPAKSTTLPADKQKQLATGVRSVGQIAKLLDRYGDANNQAQTAAQNKRLHTVLHAIEHLYPEGALKASMHGPGGHQGGARKSGAHKPGAHK